MSELVASRGGAENRPHAHIKGRHGQRALHSTSNIALVSAIGTLSAPRGPDRKRLHASTSSAAVGV